jgi:hypothetical protein
MADELVAVAPPSLRRSQLNSRELYKEEKIS